MSSSFYITFLRPEMYSSMFYISITLLCLLPVFSYLPSNKQTLLRQPAPFFLPLLTMLYAIILVIFIGFRYPFWTGGDYFADTWLYTRSFSMISDYDPINRATDWVFYNLMYFCKDVGLNVNEYYLVVATLYVGLMLLACIKLFKGKYWIALLFCISSFSFYGYAINGIRNGMATSMLMSGLALFVDDSASKPSRWIGIVLILLTAFVHSSMKLVIACVLLAAYIIKTPKQAIYIWLGCLVLSLLTGNLLSDLITATGLSDSMDSYIRGQENIEEMQQNFSSTGFRWDFLIYSAPPIFFTWYTTVKRNFQDKAFYILANTYILANAFWILIIRAAYTNRFAYLSWFLYPIIIAYPLLKFDIWKDQDRKTSIILLAYVAFTFFMQFIYYGKSFS